MKAKVSAIEKARRFRLAKGYDMIFLPKGRKFTNKVNINEVINRRSKLRTLHETRNSERRAELKFIERIKAGKVHLNSEALNSYYGAYLPEYQ